MTQLLPETSTVDAPTVGLEAQGTAAEARPLSPFVARHLGPTEADTQGMLAALGYESLEDLIGATVPAAIRLQQPLNLPQGLDEAAALAQLKALASQNQVWRSYLGLGYAQSLTPPVVQRNVLENPGWYTQYTPYQPVF